MGWCGGRIATGSRLRAGSIAIGIASAVAGGCSGGPGMPDAGCTPRTLMACDCPSGRGYMECVDRYWGGCQCPRMTYFYPGWPCSCDSDCNHLAGSYPVCYQGICMARASGHTCDPSFTAPRTVRGGLELCWPLCNGNLSCGGRCSAEGFCEPTAETIAACDPACSPDCAPLDCSTAEYGQGGRLADCSDCGRERCCPELAACRADPNCWATVECTQNCPMLSSGGLCFDWEANCPTPGSDPASRDRWGALYLCMNAQCIDEGLVTTGTSNPLWCHTFCADRVGAMCPPPSECHTELPATVDCSTASVTCNEMATDGTCAGGVCVDGTCVPCPGVGTDCTPAGECERYTNTCDATGTPRCASTGTPINEGGACTQSGGGAGTCRHGTCFVSAPGMDAGPPPPDGGVVVTPPDEICVDRAFRSISSSVYCATGPDLIGGYTNRCAYTVLCTTCGVSGTGLCDCWEDRLTSGMSVPADDRSARLWCGVTDSRTWCVAESNPDGVDEMRAWASGWPISCD